MEIDEKIMTTIGIPLKKNKVIHSTINITTLLISLRPPQKKESTFNIYHGEVVFMFLFQMQYSTSILFCFHLIYLIIFQILH